MDKRYLEDFEAGQRFESGTLTVDAGAIIAFARQFDPQPFHTDPEAAARHPLFRGHAASGWHTAALTMRLLTESRLDIAWGLIGREIEKLGWPRPVRPDDTLRLVGEVLEVRRSRSRPDFGIVRVQLDTLNQNGEPVQNLTVAMIVPAREQRPAEPVTR